jgi:predicted nucleic acid-binding protein
VTPNSGYLLDTNVISETRKKHPDPGVTAFVNRVDPSTCYLSVLTLGELRKGIALKHRQNSEVADALAAWVDGLEYGFASRILGVDAKTARLWGELSAERSRPVVDTLLASTAVVHGLVFVTRNTADVDGIPVQMLNPFAR